MELPKTYDPQKVETKIYRLWESSGFFNPDKLPGKREKAFTVVIPPPNITGSLHMGHALNAACQDILIRQKRMQNFKTLWLPGTDHAGIATQNVVEKELKKEGLTRFDLGREKFLERIWQWKKKYGNIILEQFKKMGSSLDWSRTRFTMDKGYSLAVQYAFLHYFKKGWIYKGKRVVNWCPRCKTSLSDLELEYKEEKGKLWHIKYPVKGQGKSYITVATTRPETMLGDAAVAVNPKDQRYKNLVGQKLILPLASREIPVIADYAVDQKFGTGAVKVTPAHDLIDYEIGLRHNLKAIQVIDENGRMTKAAPPAYQGLNVLEAREKILADLEKSGLLEKTEDYAHSVPKCYRCGTTIELLLSDQWFLKMEKLAQTAKEQVKMGRIKFRPKSFEKGYFDWLSNVKDWCISRQIWWGHRIPVWYCGGKEKAALPRMGFHESVVPQVFKGKTKTYRLRDHNFKVGDRVIFENTQSKTVFGYGVITEAQQTTVEKINYQDPTHFVTYKNLNELIAAFKRRNPEKTVNKQSKAYLYSYKFTPVAPADAKQGCGQIIVSSLRPGKCPVCKGKNLVPDSDTFDTWFSSALWPFATLGWPKKTKDLKNFYPTSVLSTDRGIINLWVARMIFSGLEFTDKIPFREVYIHATVLTREGKRMSKSLGTGIDPLNLIEKYGADATRFGITSQIMGGQDIRFVEDNIVMGKKFCNKIWNAARFILMQMRNPKFKIENGKLPKNLSPSDKKIVDALKKVAKSTDKNLENFRFGQAAHDLYDFFWHDFCDKYIEESKRKTDLKTKEILLFVLLNSLRLLHPFIPFVTEEIYQKLPVKNKKKFLMIESWPR
jgi:valyl-tRNA synthetase